MLCQNCARNEATTHIKRIVGGEASQLHLCYNCAEHLGYADVFSGFGFNISNMLANFFPEFSYSLPSADESERCPTCGTSFEEVIRTGMMGCADCYESFYEKLRPSLARIHGKAVHSGKTGASYGEEAELQNKITELKDEMNRAVVAQDFERAAVLRDEINALGGDSKQ